MLGAINSVKCIINRGRVGQLGDLLCSLGTQKLKQHYNSDFNFFCLLSF